MSQVHWVTGPHGSLYKGHIINAQYQIPFITRHITKTESEFLSPFSHDQKPRKFKNIHPQIQTLEFQNQKFNTVSTKLQRFSEIHHRIFITESFSSQFKCEFITDSDEFATITKKSLREKKKDRSKVLNRRRRRRDTPIYFRFPEDSKHLPEESEAFLRIFWFESPFQFR
jgi:hypothetical protein